MRITPDNPIRLADYKAPEYAVESIDLAFFLDPLATRVEARLQIARAVHTAAHAPLWLDGEDLDLLAIAIDGIPLPLEAFRVSQGGLEITAPPEGAFVLTLTTRINPQNNRRLMGLYRASGVYCTQCEADGFRRILFFPDRPDVMTRWRVRIEADKTQCPLLLSNGNQIEAGDLPEGRHYAVWEDPHKKPCYLFALVAGDLDAYSDHFITRSGRNVALNIYVERGKAPRAAYAMDALKRAMKWDEDVFGCEYDLDLFNIVAVSDFNMGAMENKGLNIFNDKFILASEDTATDQDYHNIEAIVAHEYFHNWTGNRITCRDWFQLCLKEGLTVFRDHEFSSDMRSRAVERIAYVLNLRAAQFVEDAGPLAHPVRPHEYREVNNFYTATVYTKGSELIQMLRLLVGPQNFRAGMDLYFARHDGEACIVEQFLACFAQSSGQDLTQFLRWYEQAGTPYLAVQAHYDAGAKTYRLDFAQHTPPTPGQANKLPQILPIRLGLLAKDGRQLAPDQMFVLREAQGSLTFENIPEPPIPSLLRGFSAPVVLEFARDPADLLTLARFDPDPFNRWQALQDVALGELKAAIAAARSGAAHILSPAYIAACRSVLEGALADPAFAGLCLNLPGENDLAREIGADVDPDAIGKGLETTRAALAKALAPQAKAIYETLAPQGAFSPDGQSAGRRALRAQLLRLLVAADPATGSARASAQFGAAHTMGEQVAALNALLIGEASARDTALQAFAQRYAQEPLILDTWFGLQARIVDTQMIPRLRGLMQHPHFGLDNPNRVRALIGTFGHLNPRGFHASDGSGYALLAEVIAALDASNPQIAARMATAFRSWKTLEPKRKALAQAMLEKLAQAPKLSRDLRDILDRTLGTQGQGE